MDALLSVYFEDAFPHVARDGLLDRRVRRDLTSYFSTIIQGCVLGSGVDGETACRQAVTNIIKFHEHTKRRNGNVCLMGKYHNILYVAAKLCFDWSLKDTPTVACILDEIYACEGTFERLFIGAIFGTRAPGFLFGWKSDYADQDENVRAMVYFLEHSKEASNVYEFSRDINRSETLQMIDVRFDCCNKVSPLRVVVQVGIPDILLIMLRYGADPDPIDSEISVLEMLLDILKDSDRQYLFQHVSCLKLLLRALPSIPIGGYYCETYEFRRYKFEVMYKHLIMDGLLPKKRTGKEVTELKHLCRCAIRKQMKNRFQLPGGISELPLPSDMKKYLDLMVD